MPIASGSSDAPARAEIRGSLNAGGAFSISLIWREAAGDVDWLPCAEPALELGSVKLRNQPGRSELTFKAWAASGARIGSRILESVVIYKDKQGVQRGMLLPIALGNDGGTDNGVG